jgi:hypothetical protein
MTVIDKHKPKMKKRCLKLPHTAQKGSITEIYSRRFFGSIFSEYFLPRLGFPNIFLPQIARLKFWLVATALQ